MNAVIDALSKPRRAPPRPAGHARARLAQRGVVTIARRSTKPAGIINQSGEPEIVVKVGDLTISMTPPAAAKPAPKQAEPAEPADEPEAE